MPPFCHVWGYKSPVLAGKNLLYSLRGNEKGGRGTPLEGVSGGMHAKTFVKKATQLLEELRELTGSEVVYTYGQRERRMLTHVEAARFVVQLVRAVIWYENEEEPPTAGEPLAFTRAELEDNGAEIDRVLDALGENYGIAGAITGLLRRERAASEGAQAD